MEPPPDRPQPTAKPYLRRGAGWEGRLAAAREGRRYRPKGGPVHSYGEVAPAPAPTRRSPTKPAPRHQAGAPATKRPAAGVRARPGGPSKAASGSRVGPSPQPARRAPQVPPPQPSSLAGTGLPVVAAALPAARAWGATEAEEELEELKEFCALESEVLREVSNTATCSSLGPAKPAHRQPTGQLPHPSAAGGSCARVPAAGHFGTASTWPAQQLGAEEGESSEEEGEEDVFQSDGEGGVQSASFRTQQAKSVSFAASATACAASSVAFAVDEEEAELAVQSQLPTDLPTMPTSSLVQRFFFSHKQKPEQPAPPAGEPAPDLVQKQVEELEQQVKKLNEERAKVAQQRRQVEDARARLDQDKAAFEKRKAEELAQVEAAKAEELRKLQRNRRVLEQQSRALLKLPTKREKEEIQALEAVIEKERQNAKAKDARHKLTVDRLRRQILELQDKNRELQEQVTHLEAQRLQHWAGEPGGLSPSKREAAPPSTACSPMRRGRVGSKPSTSSGLGQGSFGLPVPAAAAAASPAHSIHSEDGSDLEFEERCAEAEELDEDTILMDAALPAVRVSVHKPQPARQQAGDQQRPGPQQGAVPPVVATASQRLSFEEGFQEAPAIAALAAAAPAAPAPAASAAAAAPLAAPAEVSVQEAVSDVMSKASTALSRFNQLRESLLQHDGLQQKLASRLSSLQATPVATPAGAPLLEPAAAVQHEPAAGKGRPGAATLPAGSGTDALRTLGRMLTGGLPSQPSGSLAVQLPAASSMAEQRPALPPEDTAAAGGGGGVGGQGGTGQEQAAGEVVVSERQFSDGRVERVFASGARLQQFPNGSTKQQWPTGRCDTHFANGDVKRAWPDGRVEYFYEAVGCWHVTTGGVEVFFFPSGQVEAHHPGGVKEIVFPDGSLRKVLPDGRELAITALHLSPEIQQPAPQL